MNDLREAWVKEEKLRDVAGGEVECGDDIAELLAGDR